MYFQTSATIYKVDVYYMSTVAFDDFFGYVYPHACAFRAGGEEWIEDMCLCFFINTRSVVSKVDKNLAGIFIYAAIDADHDVWNIHAGMIDGIAT